MFAQDGRTKKIVGFEFGPRRKVVARKLLLDNGLAHIGRVYSDNFRGFKKLVCGVKQWVGKKHTTYIESFNSLLRQYISFFRRKTKGMAQTVEKLIQRVKVFIYIYNKKIDEGIYFN